MRSRIIFYMLVLIVPALLLTGFSNRHTGAPQFTCTLTTDKTIYQIGEIPQLNVQIINEGSTAVYLPGSLEGSDLKWRMPYCYFTIEKPEPDTPVFYRCGNSNIIRAIEIKLIKPSGVLNPYESIDDYGFFSDYAATQKETYRNIGVYKIQFHYTTTTQDTRTFIGNRGQWDKNSDSLKLKELLGKIPKIDIVTNMVKIRIEE